MYLRSRIILRFIVGSLLICMATACDGDRNPDRAGATVDDASSLQSPERVDTDVEFDADPSYVGSAACQRCHAQQFQDWSSSHHDLAMQPAAEDSVLGDFGNSTFDYFGQPSMFYRRDNHYFVKTEGAHGKLAEFAIEYTFGVEPLQQYLVALPRGKYQALTIAWDARPAERGGQRWYHLYPDEHIRHDDELHWTNINQNWNFMCADCHSTNLRKNYDLETDSYHTTWSDIDVGCEACHGPGAKHISLMQGERGGGGASGLDVTYHERRDAVWTIHPETGNSTRAPARTTQLEIDSCARCHSRRLTAFPGAGPGDSFLDYFQPALLDANLYHADGQVDGEVYVYGSFLQSKMYRAGVTCSDCHNPHSLKLRAEGNNLCAQCHLASKYDSPQHHFHAAGSTGAECVNCHMPTKVFMGVDSRRDHSFRIPRPDLSVALGTPNACTDCHTDRSAQWALDILNGKQRRLHGAEYAYALYAGRHDLPQAPSRLVELVLDDTQPVIARATAVSLLPRYLSPQTAPVLQSVAQGNEPLLGYALAGVLQSLPERYRPAFAVPLLYENSRVTRSLAARSLVGLPLDQFPPEVAEKYQRALADYETSERFNGDRPESLVNLAGLYAARGEGARAGDFYQRAIKLAPWFTPAYINFADLRYRQGRERDGQAVLRSALRQVRDTAPVAHALGLSLVRTGDHSQALDYLRSAAQGPQATDRYRYVYGVALNSLGHPDAAIAELEQAHQQFPGNRDIIAALAAISRDRGLEDKARHYQQLLSGDSGSPSAPAQ